MKKEKWRYYAPVAVCLLLIVILICLPTGYEGAVQYKEAERCIAKVVAVDNSTVVDSGLVRSGEQFCTVTFLNGMFKGKTATAINLLQGSLEQDKLFSNGDTALVVISHDGETIRRVTMIDYFRVPIELLLAGIFILFLIIFAGRTGVRAILSFTLTILAIWKLLVPLFLNGYNPIWVGLLINLMLTTLSIALVYGFDSRCAAAVSGSFLGILVACVLGVLFTNLLRIHGAVMAYSESLLYAGFQHLNLTQIFMASVFLGSSGAVMDLSVDITSAVHEVVEKKPDIRNWEAVKSGMNVGRAAMGTMTTTLLLAYSGGYIALLMVFMAQGTPTQHIFNYKYVAAEIIHTVIGSFGLVSVAPFTALCAGLLLTRKVKGK
ncbi:MAG: YibE/F family protein [Eubacteriales bacterium]